MTCRSSLTPGMLHDIVSGEDDGAVNVLRTWSTNVRVLQMCCELYFCRIFAARSQHLIHVGIRSTFFKSNL